MEFTFAKAVAAEAEQIGALFQQGKEFLWAQGIDQWRSADSPSAVVALQDTEKGEGYVFRDQEGLVAAYAAVIPGIDPTYVHINGSWLSNGPYCAVHRVAVSNAYKGQGLAKRFLAQIHAAAKAMGCISVRIDTHADNKIMQKVILGSGYTYCGIIQTAAGADRNAYEIIL